MEPLTRKPARKEGDQEMKWIRPKAETANENVTPIENDYIREQSDKKAWSVEQRRKQRRRMTAILVTGAAFIVPLASSTLSNLQEMQVMEQKIALAKEEQKAVEEKNDTLNQQVELLEDEEFVAKLARSRYYLSKEGEVIFSLPEDNRSKAAHEEKTD